MVKDYNVAAYAANADTWCADRDCCPVEDTKENRDNGLISPIFWGEQGEYDRGLYCRECREEIFPDKWKVTIMDKDDNVLTCTVEVKRFVEGDKHPVFNGQCYTATIELTDFKESETVNFWTSCIYEPSATRAFYDLREMLEYSSDDYPNPIKLVEYYDGKTVKDAVLWTARWYESGMLRGTLSALFGNWFDAFINGDYDGYDS